MSIWTTQGVGEYRALEKHLFIAPKKFARDNTVRPILYCRSHGNTAEQAMERGWIGKIVERLAETRPVLSVDLGGVATWGNDTGLTALSAARIFASTKFGCKIDKIGLLATSMGALDALNWAKANPTLVESLVGIIPVVNLSDIYVNNRSGYATEIGTAYGGAPPASKNPSQNAASFMGIPLAFWYASNDPVIIPAEVTNFASATNADVHSLGAVGHTPVSTPPEDVAAFFAAHA